MKRSTLATTSILVAAAIVHGQPTGQAGTQDAKIEQEVRAVRQELAEAGRRKDRAAFERLLADGFTFVHSTGGMETRQEYIDHAVSGTQLFQRAELETLEEQIQIYEDRVAVWTSRSVARTRGENTELNLRSTNLFVKTAGRWQWASGQSTRLPSRPKAAAIDPGLYKGYAGRYEIGPGRTLTVTEEGGTLRGLVTGFRPAELIPRSETEFAWFNPDYNVYSQILFVKDDSGRVTHAAFRREGEEIWRAKKVQ